MNPSKKITVTSPLLPDLNEFGSLLQDIWNSKWLTNNGDYHKKLEQELCDYLGVKYISLFSNGTLALITALQALQIKGEVITTPYSFVATTHSLWWHGLKPVFVDIDPISCNISPDKIEAAITPETTAILPVHVYGTPCDTKRIQAIADKHNLKIIYDAAHTFGVTQNGESLLNFGDLSILSFHATKVYSTIEGGAIICHDEKMKHRIDNLKNFGFRGETIVEEPGINAKMNEVQAAFGLLSLKLVDKAIEKRKYLSELYRENLAGIKGISCLQETKNVKHNYGYFPIFVNSKDYGMERDELYEKMKTENIFGRRYFYPLISNFSSYSQFPSSHPDHLPVANKIAGQVICLPLHHELNIEDIERTVDIIKKGHE